MQRMSLEIVGKHGSIESMIWEDIPPLAIITGENGAGKTHLLEVLAQGFGLGVPQMSGGRLAQTKKIEASVSVLAGNDLIGRPFYADANWLPNGWGSATLDDISQEAHRLYTNGASAAAAEPCPALYSKWMRATKSEGEVSVTTISPPDWDEFESCLLPEHFLGETFQEDSLARLFLAYEVLRLAAIERAKRNHEDLANAADYLCRPPWELLNEFCGEADVGFEIVPPVVSQRSILSRPSAPYRLQLKDTKRNTVVDVSDASSGERIMLSVIAWRFIAQARGKHYGLIILDEPDAHLHPSLVRKFLQVIRTVLVEQYGARVIMSTHSPSTVALAPMGSVFELRRSGTPRLVPVDNHDAAVARLTDGLVAVGPATRFVVIEGPTDVPFYRSLWELAKSDGFSPFPGISFLNRDGGCSKVKDTVRFLREGDFQRFFGILDRDAGRNINLPEPGIFVHERNGVENYWFDPLNVWLCLWLFKPELHKGRLYQISSLRQGAGYSLRDQQPGHLQAAVDSVCALVAGTIGTSLHSDMVNATFTHGVNLKYPAWVMQMDDHSYAKAVRQAFEPYPFPLQQLQDSFMTLNLVPTEFMSMFREMLSV